MVFQNAQHLIYSPIISGVVFAQDGQESIDDVLNLLKGQENVAYFDVSKEMFQMLSESRNASSEFKEYVSKLTSLKMVKLTIHQSKSKVHIYKTFMQMVNLKDFSRLMTSESSAKRVSFYQKKNQKVNEYLLVQSNAVIYITGTIDLKSIGEFNQILEVAGGAFEM